MKKEPIITHTEILSRAIDSVKREIDYWDEKMGSNPAFAKDLKTITAPLHKKLEILETMYVFETGVEY